MYYIGVRMTRKKLYPTKRLSVIVPEDMHKQLEKIAIKRHETITRIVMQAIYQRLQWESQFD